jgi:hypothetical protein
VQDLPHYSEGAYVVRGTESIVNLAAFKVLAKDTWGVEGGEDLRMHQVPSAKHALFS